ncbi:hypothetical protein PGTUg99_011625 [Puccinia graminis f. sp. tritici]|uniref:Uncharacterized protein n=1 Tax=Puccinia graminis f. sp. tritici TaxID=56615 RepID=A0A5B0RCK5_PUCGR|nr:hypothetical protein PGTUg99_011625 [Puccinia graminis f. sp. tritici]
MNSLYTRVPVGLPPHRRISCPGRFQLVKPRLPDKKPIPSHPKMDAAMNDGNQAAARDAAQDEAQRAEAAPQIETISVVVRPIKVIHSTK